MPIEKKEADALVQVTRACWELTSTHSKVIAELMLKINDPVFVLDMAELVMDIHSRGRKYMDAFVCCIEYLEDHAPERVKEFEKELAMIGYGH